MWLAVAGFSAGILLLQHLPILPWPPGGSLGLCGLALPGVVLTLGPSRPSYWARGLTFLLAGLLGFAYAHHRAETRMADELPQAWEQQDIELIGQIIHLPERLPAGLRPGQRFDVRVETVLTPGAQVPSQIRLSWYGDIPSAHEENDTDAEDGEVSPLQPRDLQAGARWQFTVRLKRPHGNINPSGFDYEAWLLQHHIRATGYVRATHAKPRFWGRSVVNPLIWLEAQRGRLRTALETALPEADWPYAGILKGLAIGDQAAIPDSQWQVFNQTGTTHLMVVSGSHITLFAAGLAFLANRLWRRSHRATLWLPAQRVGLLVGAVSGLVYAGLTGLGIPAQRTVLMLLVVALNTWRGQHPGPARVLSSAWVVVLVFDPWAVLSAGFWLSFVTVAALLLVSEAPRAVFWQHLWHQHWQHQWAASLATLPLLVLYFQRLPLVSPLANLIAIPAVSLLLTPLTLLGLLALTLPGPLASWGIAMLTLAHAACTVLYALLDWLAASPNWFLVAAPNWAIVLAAMGMAFGLLPTGVPSRRSLLVLCSLPALFWPAAHPEPGTWWVDVLDVGQGQSVLIRTAQHALLYDSGPQYGPPGGGQPSADAGQRVILPFLRAQGVTQLDLMLISHRDRDHSGGSSSLKAGLPIVETRSSQPGPNETRCLAGQSWTWDDVQFTVLHPDADRLAKATGKRGHNNALSCVLQVRDPRGQAILLPGDLPAAEEGALVQREGPALRSALLLAPHHGSHSSSSPAFLEAVQPHHILVSSGYRNRFHHPHAEVLARYENAGQAVWRTDQLGALQIRPDGENIRLQGARQLSPRYWHDPPLRGDQASLGGNVSVNWVSRRISP